MRLKNWQVQWVIIVSIAALLLLALNLIAHGQETATLDIEKGTLTIDGRTVDVTGRMELTLSDQPPDPDTPEGTAITGDGPFTLTGGSYYLADSVRTERGGFTITGDDVTLDLWGHDIVYDTEPGVDALPVFSGWDLGAGWVVQTADADSFRLGRVFPKDGTEYLTAPLSGKAETVWSVHLNEGQHYALQGHVGYYEKCRGRPTLGWEVDDGQGNVYRASHTGAPGQQYCQRGMQLMVETFTAKTTGLHTVRAFVRDAEGEKGEAYFAYPRVTYHSRHGIEIGNAKNFTLKNSRGVSRIMPGKTGAQASYQSHCLTGGLLAGGVVTIEGNGDKNDSLQFHAHGAMSRAVNLASTSHRTGTQIRNGCLFRAYSGGILSRDHMHGSVVSVSTKNCPTDWTHHRITGCRIDQSAHMGFVVGKGQVDNNWIGYDSWYTNDFAITVNNECRVHDNVIDFSAGSGRGILVNGGARGQEAIIKDNTLIINSRPQNSEYRGHSISGNYGVQVEGSGDVFISYNRGKLIGPGWLVRINPAKVQGQAIDIFENGWVVELPESHNRASGVYAMQGPANPVTAIYRETITTNNGLFRNSSTANGELVLRDLIVSFDNDGLEMSWPYIAEWNSTGLLKLEDVTCDEETAKWLSDRFRAYYSGQVIEDSHPYFGNQRVEWSN